MTTPAAEMHQMPIVGELELHFRDGIKWRLQQHEK
jgi:hypothetical protein